MKRYGTTKRGKIKFEIGSEQDKYLHTMRLPHSHVTIEEGKKEIVRWYTKGVNK